MIIVKHCQLASRDHRKSKRQYAHTFHKGDNVICVAKSYFDLPLKYKVGLLVHEIGHLFVGRRGSEEDADKIIKKFFGVRIKYKDSLHGKYLQWLNPNEIRKVLGRLKYHVLIPN